MAVLAAVLGGDDLGVLSRIQDRPSSAQVGGPFRFARRWLLSCDHLRGRDRAAAIGFPFAVLPLLRVAVALRPAVFGLGIVTIALGSLLRRHCWRLLGSSFTGDVRADPNQRIMTTGAYALLRHPSYSAGILMNIGLGLALGSWASTALLAAAAFAVYGYRIAVEERTLLRVVGEPYREFIRTRRRLIPFIY